MPASKQSETNRLIRKEIYRALESFGASDELSIVDDVNPQSELYEAFQRLGAKSDLLSIVGSWGDTMDDEWVLSALREWNWRLRPMPGGRAD